MTLRIRTQLSLMMFMEFFIWGVWFVTMGTYLNVIGFQGIHIGNAYSTQCWAAIITPFFIGMIADRFFSAQKVLAVMHLCGGVLIYLASTLLEPGPFFFVLLLYMFCYMPTLALANTISFNQMENPGKEFPSIRVWGTLGWIVGSTIVSLLKVESTAIPMQICAGVSILMGIYSLTLPATPPTSTGKRVTIGDVLGLKALQLLKDPSFLVFIIASFLICVPLAFYYAFTNMFLNELGMEYAAAKMSLGQWSEILFMIIMPFFFVRLGVKKMLLIGMLAWAVRYVLFAFGADSAMVWMLYGGIVLHGICYDFFFVTGQIHVDREAPKEVQASAQGFIALVTYGAGMLIGNWMAGFVVDKYPLISDTGEVIGHAWKNIWLVPAVMTTVVIVGFAVLFKGRKEDA